MEGPLNSQQRATVEKYLLDRDFFVYSGPIESDALNGLIEVFSRGNGERASELTVAVTTYGGDAHVAYRVARLLQTSYESIRFLVVGPCKSAGTLIAIAADEVSFSPFGELGPLDVQLGRRDEILGQNSGLDSLQTFGMIQGWAYSMFESYMVQIVEKSFGQISTRMACDVAGRLVRGIMSPLLAQVDPHRLSEIQRMMTIATAYGRRLGDQNLQPDALGKLVNSYPSHAFVIDQQEASDLFKSVSGISPEDRELLFLAGEFLDGAIFRPANEPIWLDFRSLVEQKKVDKGKRKGVGDVGSAGSSGTHEQGKPSDSDRVSSPGSSDQSAGGPRLLSRRPRVSEASRGRSGIGEPVRPPGVEYLV